MTRARVLLLVVVLWAAVGCANMTPTQQRALSGGAIGAAGGAAVGAIVGEALRSEPWLGGGWYGRRSPLGGHQQGPQVEGTPVVRHERCMQTFSRETSTAKSV
jgi:osmotically inducible lipoprotein OsmB